jgi:hypothetical protein
VLRIWACREQTPDCPKRRNIFNIQQDAERVKDNINRPVGWDGMGYRGRKIRGFEVATTRIKDLGSRHVIPAGNRKRDLYSTRMCCKKAVV